MCEVARRMNYHRNTILYHVKKIKENTGLDPLKVDDLIKLKNVISQEAFVKCVNCEYYGTYDSPDGSTTWCRNENGLPGELDPEDGCSRGKKKERE